MLGLWHIIIIGLAYIYSLLCRRPSVWDQKKVITTSDPSHIVALIAILFTSLSYGHTMSPLSIFLVSAYTYAQNQLTEMLMVGWSWSIIYDHHGQYHLGGNLLYADHFQM